MKAERYRILDLDVVLRSDSELFWDLFHTDHALFTATGPPADRCLTVVYRTNSGEGAVLTVDGVSRSLAESSRPEAHAYQMVLGGIMKAVRGFVVLHGGVVAAGDGRALAVCGLSGTGKTTLVTALLEEGFQFLSDDYCPIHQETRRVHPYPRTMWRVPKGRNGVPGVPSHGGMHGVKTPVPLDPRKVRIATEPRELGSLICIDPGENKDPWCTIRVYVDKRGEEILLNASAGLDGVVAERLDGEEPVWAIRYRKGEGHVRKAAAILKAVEPHAFSMVKEGAYSPEYLREPTLRRISCVEAAHLLLVEPRREPEGLRARPGRYFMHLVDLLSPIPCWHLTTGYLDKMRDLALSTLQ